MTAVRIPVRLRLDLDPAQPHEALADPMCDGTEQAACRLADRARLPGGTFARQAELRRLAEVSVLVTNLAAPRAR